MWYFCHLAIISLGINKVEHKVMPMLNFSDFVIRSGGHNNSSQKNWRHGLCTTVSVITSISEFGIFLFFLYLNILFWFLFNFLYLFALECNSSLSLPSYCIKSCCITFIHVSMGFSHLPFALPSSLCEVFIYFCRG